jgi:glycosyltransferase involved in cell wall biosynthesis
MNPVVVFDADVLGRQRTGDESYAENLLRELPKLAPDLRFAAIIRDPGRLPPGIEPLAVAFRSQFLRMGLALPALLRRLSPALLHFQYVLPPARPAPAVLTVHDVSFERDPQFMAPHDRLLFRTLVPRSARAAARVLTGSECTKRELLERYGLPSDKVVVTPYGIDPIFGTDGARPNGRPYLLFVGALQPRKDPLTAVEALPLVDSELRLVLAGPQKRGGGDLRRRIASLGLERRVDFLGHLSKPDLAALYRGAACLVFPSRWEGFGLPVVEAMASGTPVVATSAGALPEVAGDAAILVEPGNPVALAGGIERALADRERLVAAGLARARRFSWTETARRTLQVYRELL